MYCKNKDNNGSIERYQAASANNSEETANTDNTGMYVAVVLLAFLAVGGFFLYRHHKEKIVSSQTPIQQFGFKFY